MTPESSSSLPAVRQQARNELANHVNTVIDHERRKARAAVEVLCQSESVTLDRFNDLVAKSKLIPDDDWQAALSEAPVDDLLQWVNRLQESDLLSAWQIHKLLSGKYKGFVVGNYQVRDTLGQGSAGAVYFGQHQTMRRPVALKVLAEKVTRSDDLMKITFERMGLMGDLDHDHVVHYFDVGESNRAVYLVMELINGRSLQQLIRRYRRLPRHLVREIGRQMADAYQYIHSETGVLPRGAADNVVAEDCGQIHVLPLDLTATLSLGLNFDQKSVPVAIANFRDMLCALDPPVDVDQPVAENSDDENSDDENSDDENSDDDVDSPAGQEADASALGPWHRWTDDQITAAAESSTPWSEIDSWLAT